jgi:hypothetical protein
MLEELVIKIRHDADPRDMQRIRADARKAADEIAKRFDQAADDAGDAAKEIADDHGKAAKHTSEVWTGALRQVGARLTDFGVAAAGAIGSYIADTFEATRVTDQFAKTLGVSTSEMMAMEKGFERARVPAENTREAIKTLRENLGELERLGTGPARDSLGSLGLTFEDFKGKTPTEQIKLLADALRNVEDPMKRTSIAIELMGEDGQRLMPALLDGADGVDALAQAARDAGQVLDEETIEKTRELDEALLSMKGQAEGVALSIIEKAVPSLTKAAEGAGEWFEENEDLIAQDMPKVIDAIATAVQGLASAFIWAAEKSAALGDSLFSFSQWASENKEWVALFAAGIPGGQGLIPSILGNDTGGGNDLGDENRKLYESLKASGELTTEPSAIEGRSARREAIRAAEQRTTDAQLFLIEQRKREEEQGRVALQRERATAFEAGEKDKTDPNKPKGPRRGGRTKRDDPELIAAREEARMQFEEEFSRVGAQFGATSKAIEAAIEAAAQDMVKGGNLTTQRSAGLGAIGRLTGTKNIERQATTDPLSALFGVESLPDISPAELAQDRAPDVLTATINNTYAINQTITIDGSTRPDLVPDQLKDAMRSIFGDLERESKYTKVVFAR